MESNNNNKSGAGAAPHHQPTIAALPPQEEEDDEGARLFRTIPINDDDVVNSNNNNNKSTNMAPDTSNDAALAASLAQEEERLAAAAAAAETGGTTSLLTSNNSNNSNASPSSPLRAATASSPWQYDDQHPQCYGCGETFTALNRRHHCRLCGRVVCHACSDQKALIPPSQIVLHPVRGKRASSSDPSAAPLASFSPDDDPDRMLTYYSTSNTPAAAAMTNDSTSSNNPQTPQPQPQQQLLYGKGLEERFQLAREPLRVCARCWTQLQPLQEELRRHNAHCMRFNHVDPCHPKRLLNSPLAFTLGHEIRKAAYALHNLLPQPKRSGAVVEAYDSSYNNNNNNMLQSELQQCQQNCRGLSPNLGDLDGVQIPARLLEQAKGVAVLTCAKGGFGLAGVEFGTGLVVARLDSNRWSAPSAIGTAGVAWGALIGAQLVDHVFLLMTDAAVTALFQDKGASVQLGADVGVAVGPVGRALEGDWNVGGHHRNNNNYSNVDSQQQTPPPQLGPSIYTYSLSKGLYAGVSLDGKVVTTRHDFNERFYGRQILPSEILRQPSPPAAQPLYEALQRCHVYATAAANSRNHHHHHRRDDLLVIPESAALVNEYGEVVGSGMAAGGAMNSGDPPSVANMSDITSDF